ncbi:MAG: nuclear transport factor 2 family protein [Deinococcota bacterium]
MSKFKINVQADCGNAPRKLLLRDISIAFVENDVEMLLEHAHKDITWNRVGNSITEGKAAFEEVLLHRTLPEARELTLHHILTHGKEGAVSGTVMFNDGLQHDFCDVYVFSSTTSKLVKVLRSFGIAGGS